MCVCVSTAFFTKKTSMEFEAREAYHREMSLDKVSRPASITAKLLLFHFAYCMLMDCFNN